MKNASKIIEKLQVQLEGSIKYVIRLGTSHDHGIVYAAEDIDESFQESVPQKVNEVCAREIDETFSEVGREYLEDLFSMGKHRFSVEVFDEGRVLFTNRDDEITLIVVDE